GRKRRRADFLLAAFCRRLTSPFECRASDGLAKLKSSRAVLVTYGRGITCLARRLLCRSGGRVAPCNRVWDYDRCGGLCAVARSVLALSRSGRATHINLSFVDYATNPALDRATE